MTRAFGLCLVLALAAGCYRNTAPSAAGRPASKASADEVVRRGALSADVTCDGDRPVVRFEDPTAANRTDPVQYQWVLAWEGGRGQCILYGLSLVGREPDLPKDLAFVRMASVARYPKRENSSCVCAPGRTELKEGFLWHRTAADGWAPVMKPPEEGQLQLQPARP